MPLVTYIFIFLTFLSNKILTTEHLQKEMVDCLPKQVCNYLNALPKIDRRLVAPFHPAQAMEIVRFLQAFPPSEDKANTNKPSEDGSVILALQIQRYLVNSQELKMRITGFPFKSTNHKKKVLSSQIDMGELIAILTLNHICSEISHMIQPKKAKIIIVSDGAAFKDVLGVSDDDYFSYEGSVRAIIHHFEHHLTFISPCEQVFHPYRWELLESDDVYKIDEVDLQNFVVFAKEELAYDRSGVLYSVSAPWKFEQPHHFTKHNFESLALYLALDGSPSESALFLAKMLMSRSQIFDKFIQKYIPECCDTIRLSVHSHQDISKKCGISLVHGSMGTPWHKVPELTNETVSLVKGGSSILRKSSGSGIQRNRSGSSIQRNSSGSSIQRNSSGSDIQRNSSGSDIQRNSSGSSIQRNSSGSEIPSKILASFNFYGIDLPYVTSLNDDTLK